MEAVEKPPDGLAGEPPGRDGTELDHQPKGCEEARRTTSWWKCGKTIERRQGCFVEARTLHDCTDAYGGVASCTEIGQQQACSIEAQAPVEEGWVAGRKVDGRIAGEDAPACRQSGFERRGIGDGIHGEVVAVHAPDAEDVGDEDVTVADGEAALQDAVGEGTQSGSEATEVADAVAAIEQYGTEEKVIGRREMTACIGG